MELIFSNPDSVVEFLSNYLSNSQMTLSEKVKQNFAAFLAAFSLPDDPDQGTVQVGTLDTLFDAVSKSYPESFVNADNLTPIQKAEALTAFFSSVDEKLQLASTKLTETVSAFDSLTADHQALLLASESTASELLVSAAELAEANTRIQELTGQLAARPTIPLNVTDPALSLTLNHAKDETGKQILASMPPDIKRKLSSHPSTT
jgi:hypothetical protein